MTTNSVVFKWQHTDRIIEGTIVHTHKDRVAVVVKGADELEVWHEDDCFNSRTECIQNMIADRNKVAFKALSDIQELQKKIGEVKK